MLSRIEELMLVSRCALSDDRDAFGRLVEEYQSDIRRFFINLTGDVALSDDLSQDTFIKAYTGIRGFKGFSRFRTWLYRMPTTSSTIIRGATKSRLKSDCRSRQKRMSAEATPKSTLPKR